MRSDLHGEQRGAGIERHQVVVALHREHREQQESAAEPRERECVGSSERPSPWQRRECSGQQQRECQGRRHPRRDETPRAPLEHARTRDRERRNGDRDRSLHEHTEPRGETGHCVPAARSRRWRAVRPPRRAARAGSPAREARFRAAAPTRRSRTTAEACRDARRRSGRHQPVATGRRHDSTHLGVAMLIDVGEVVRASERHGQQRHRHDHPGASASGMLRWTALPSGHTRRIHHAGKVSATTSRSTRMNGTSSLAR